MKCPKCGSDDIGQSIKMLGTRKRWCFTCVSEFELPKRSHKEKVKKNEMRILHEKTSYTQSDY